MVIETTMGLPGGRQAYRRKRDLARPAPPRDIIGDREREVGKL